MIELVHDQGQVHALHPCMIAPGLSQRVRAVVAGKSHVPTNRGDELPGLTPLDGLSMGRVLGAEKDKPLQVSNNPRIGLQILAERPSNAIVDDHLVALPALTFSDPEALFGLAILVDEVADLQWKQVGDAKCGVDAYHKKQQITIAILTAEKVFDLCDLFGGADGFNKVHLSRWNCSDFFGS